ncbi:hypothetical protein [Caulobacter sp. LjRoot300]|uniref:hypothetical protein n=1 Tax=Caulobacter sp. LjRoot300 TaxID=3342321 RepID=UPI003ECCF19A
MNGTALAIVGTAIAVLGVAATLISPRLTRRTRIFCDITEVSKFGDWDATGDISLEVLHNGFPISGQLYLFFGYIENTGSMDVTKDHFVQSINVSTKPGIELITAEARSISDAGVNFQISNGLGNLRWTILKPGEIVKIKGVVRILDQTIKKIDSDQISISARLKDVSIGKNWKSSMPFMVANIMTSTIMASVVLIAGFFLSGKANYPTYTDRNGEIITIRQITSDDFILPNKDRNFIACLPVKMRFLPSKCKKIDKHEAEAAFNKSKIMEAYTGIQKEAYFASLLIFFGVFFVNHFVVNIMSQRLRKMSANSNFRRLFLLP